MRLQGGSRLGDPERREQGRGSLRGGWVGGSEGGCRMPTSNLHLDLWTPVSPPDIFPSVCGPQERKRGAEMARAIAGAEDHGVGLEAVL